MHICAKSLHTRHGCKVRHILIGVCLGLLIKDWCKEINLLRMPYRDTNPSSQLQCGVTRLSWLW